MNKGTRHQNEGKQESKRPRESQSTRRGTRELGIVKRPRGDELLRFMDGASKEPLRKVNTNTRFLFNPRSFPEIWCYNPCRFDSWTFSFSSTMGAVTDSEILGWKLFLVLLRCRRGVVNCGVALWCQKVDGVRDIFSLIYFRAAFLCAIIRLAQPVQVTYLACWTVGSILVCGHRASTYVLAFSSTVFTVFGNCLKFSVDHRGSTNVSYSELVMVWSLLWIIVSDNGWHSIYPPWKHN